MSGRQACIETIWGPLGFEWVVKNDYGKFTNSELDFTVIPHVPDGHRIKRFVNTFDKIKSDTIYIEKSNWCNLTTLQNFVPNNKYINADLTGAPLKVGNGLFQAESGSLYLKGKFVDGANVYNSHKAWIAMQHMSKFVVDDDNKYTNLPFNNNGVGAMRWQGTGPAKLEYFCNQTCLTDGKTHQFGYIHSDNNKYDITYPVGGNLAIIRLDERFSQYRADLADAVGDEITIDCTYNGDIKLKNLVGFFGNKGKNGEMGWYYKITKLLFKGEVTSLDWFYPHLWIDGEYPDWIDMSLLDKLQDNNNSKIFYFALFNKPVKCPLTFDLTNRQYVDIFDYPNNTHLENYCATYLTSSDDGVVQATGYNYFDILPTFTNFEGKTFKYLSFGQIYLANLICGKLPSGTWITDEFYTNGFLIPKDTVIKSKKWSYSYMYQPFGYESIAEPHFIGLVNDKGGLTSPSIQSNYGSNITALAETGEELNTWEFESLDESVIKATIQNSGSIAAFIGYTTNYNVKIINKAPVVIVGGNNSWASIGLCKIAEGTKVIVYRTNLTIAAFWNNSSFAQQGLEDVRRLLAGVWENDSDTTYTIKIHKLIYDLLDESEITALENLNYTVTRYE